MLPQNRKNIQTQVARIKQPLEKVLDQNKSLAERVRTSFHEQGITIFSVLTAFLMTISIIVLTITDFYRGRVRGGRGGEEGEGYYLSKNEGVLNKLLNRLADALKRLAGKAITALPTIVGSVFGAILSFLGKAVGFVAEDTWALIVFVTGLICV